MDDKECFSCVYFDIGNCDKIDTVLRTSINLMKLVDSGEFSDCLRDNLDYLTQEEVSRIVKLVYNFLFDNLEITIKKILLDNNFYCKYFKNK